MSNRTATLYLRVTTKDGKAPFCMPVYLSKGRLKPHYAIVNRQPEHHPEGVYYVRFGREGRKQKFVPVGNDPYVALDKLAEKERWLRDRERGVPYSDTDSPKPEGSRLRVDAAADSTSLTQDFRYTYPGESGQRNNFRGDGFFGIDMGLSKIFAITERENVKFSWETFNITNSNRFDVQNISTNIQNPASFGQYNAPTLTVARVMQFALRYSF